MGGLAGCEGEDLPEPVFCWSSERRLRVVGKGNLLVLALGELDQIILADGGFL